MRLVVGAITAAAFVLEVAIISMQAWRGTTSHFNVGTPLDAWLFGVMGAAILGQTLATLPVLVALWRQTFAHEALGTALRAGVLITVLGAFTGGLMTRPTEAQLSDAQATGRIQTVGAHTVGGPDGGPGLPGTGWSREHGDLRIPHFIGLHAMQILPLLSFVILKRSELGGQRSSRHAVRMMRIASGSYAGLFVMLLTQALRGQSILEADQTTLVLTGVWSLVTLLAVLWVRRPEVSGSDPVYV